MANFWRMDINGRSFEKHAKRCNLCIRWHVLYSLSCLAHGSITMRWCVAYIHDPDTTLTLTSRSNLYIFYINLYPPPPWTNFRGVCVYINHSVCPSVCAYSCPAISFVGFDIGLPYLALWCITMTRCVAYIDDPGSTLNFDRKVKLIGLLKCFCVRRITIIWFDIGLSYFGTWVYHHENMWQVHSYSGFDVDIWSQGQIYRLLLCVLARLLTAVSFDSGLPY